MLRSRQALEAAIADGQSFANQTFEGLNLDGLVTSTVNFSGTTWLRCSVRNASFSQSIFQNAKFVECDFSGTEWSNCPAMRLDALDLVQRLRGHVALAAVRAGNDRDILDDEKS